MEIENSIKTATQTRGIKRTDAISQATTNFYNFLKDANYTTFNKSLLLSFFPEGIKERTKQRIQKEVFKLLIGGGNITKIKTIKTDIALRNKPLSCGDYNSYNILMSKNGYKAEYYKNKYDEQRQIPIKVKVGSSRLSENLNIDYDEREIKSDKPRERQGVYTNSPFSVVRHKIKREVVLYKVN